MAADPNISNRAAVEDDTGAVPDVISRWQGSAASERSNYGLFLIELCEVLGLPRPEPATGEPERDEYVFERPVHFHDSGGSTSTGFIDLSRRGCRLQHRGLCRF
jgi:hypothetical protein